MQVQFKKNIISHQVIKSKSDKIYKKVIRDAKKKIKNGQLLDETHLKLHLKNIDAEYSYLISYVENTSHIIDYKILRSRHLSDAKEKLIFFSQEIKKLNQLREEMIEKAKEADVTNKIKNTDIEIDISKLEKEVNELDKKEKA